jgi:hypothetical protein
MALGQLEWRMGLHLFQFEPPDILWVKYRGPFSLQEALLMTERLRELGAVRPYFLVNDMTEAGPLAADAGHYFGENLPFDRLLGLIYIGGRLLHRAAAKGILLAAYLTESTRDQTVPDMGRFVSTQEEACALIIQLRVAATAQRPAEENLEAGASLLIVRGPSW